jgi:hypothetical protein
LSSKKYDKLAEYGYGFSEKNLRRMVQLNEVFPNADCYHHHLAIGDGSQEEKREILAAIGGYSFALRFVT